MNSGKDALGLNKPFRHYKEWKKNGSGKADYIIVDEIQDFDKDEISALKSAAKKCFFFFGDTAQSIYEGLKSTQIIRDIAYEANLSEFQLYFNYRLPKTIARITEDHIGIDTKYNDGTYKSNENTIPRIIQYNNREEQLKAIVRIVKKNNLTDVGILFPINDQVKYASEFLTREGLNNEAKYKDKADWKNNKDTLNFNSSNPKLMTYHSAKGLQFETVFLPDCSIEKTFNNNSQQKSLYVAMTRCYKNLYVLHNDNLTSFISGNVPVNLYKITEFDKIDDI
jgi:superfamily I DNA/RNA helicase